MVDLGASDAQAEGDGAPRSGTRQQVCVLTYASAIGEERSCMRAAQHGWADRGTGTGRGSSGQEGTSTTAATPQRP